MHAESNGPLINQYSLVTRAQLDYWERRTDLCRLRKMDPYDIGKNASLESYRRKTAFRQQKILSLGLGNELSFWEWHLLGLG